MRNVRLEGKKVVIAGASGEDNIGQGIARRFATEGAKILVAGRRLENLEKFAAEIDGFAAEFDIETDGSAESLMETAMAKLGGIDIVVNAVGGGSAQPFLETTRSDLEWMARLQFIGPYQLLQAALKRMSDNGAIIHISSVGALRVIEDQIALMASKAGFDHVIRNLANEFGCKGIRINSLSPGLTDTPMSRGVIGNEKFVEAFTRNYPLGRLGTREEIGAAAVYLASDECFVTGENLQVNGGLNLRRLPNAAEMQASFEDLNSGD